MANERMTNKEFVERLRHIAESLKTTYVLGGWGQNGTLANKAYFKACYKKNRTSDTIKAGIDKADADTFFFDCNCLIKSVIDGFVADNTKKMGGATYGKPCPDVNIEDMLSGCSDVSTDMSNIEIGEYLVYKDLSHSGIYVGEIGGVRYAVECTYRWLNGVQLICIDRDERKDMWGYHGKLTKYIRYTTSAECNVASLKSLVDTKVLASIGDTGEYVKSIQRVLTDKGYSCGACGADGKYGNDTAKAVAAFQEDSDIESTGTIDLDTITALTL